MALALTKLYTDVYKSSIQNSKKKRHMILKRHFTYQVSEYLVFAQFMLIYRNQQNVTIMSKTDILRLHTVYSPCSYSSEVVVFSFLLT